MLRSKLSAKKARRSREQTCLQLKNYLNVVANGRAPKSAKATATSPGCLCIGLQAYLCQVIDDTAGATLVAASTLDADFKSGSSKTADVAAASAVGKLVAERAKSKGINAVVFDRGGYIFHGRVKALAEAAREAGLKF